MDDENPPSTPSPGVPPPPGWYADPETGRRRWWDGNAWGPFAAEPGRSSNSTVLAVLAHVGMLFAAVLLPLILYVTAGTDDPDVRHHAREALNFQLTFLAGWILGFVVMFVSMFNIGPGDPPPLAFFIAFPLMFLYFLAALGMSAYAAVQAGRGRRWRYPLSVRVVGRSEDRAERDRQRTSA